MDLREATNVISESQRVQSGWFADYVEELDSDRCGRSESDTVSELFLSMPAVVIRRAAVRRNAGIDPSPPAKSSHASA
jgi:hypothetical protein